jgi:hypothetical protein
VFRVALRVEPLHGLEKPIPLFVQPLNCRSILARPCL